jgi:PDZ domain-containing protein
MRGTDRTDAVKTAVKCGLAAAAAALLLFVVPMPYVLYEPGKVVPVGELVTAGGAEAAERGPSPEPGREGEWLLTTVYLEPRATLWQVIESLWREDREAHSKRAVFGGSGATAYKARMDALMAESQSRATEAAYRLAGVRYETWPDGVVVARGAGGLEAGDRIVAVNGAAVDGLAALEQALRAAGREAELTVRRGGREIAVRADAERDGAEAASGRLGGAELIEIRAVRPEDPGLRVTMNAGDFAGPSAGLALALHIYERLAGETLTGGRRIAATGTIEPSGAVGAVGGVGLKAIAASRAGAGLFLVPEANAAEAAAAAKAAGGGMAVAGVRSLEEAVALLRAAC